MKIENIKIPNLGISKRFDRVTWLTDDKDRDILIDAVKKSISFVFSSDRRVCEEGLHSVASGTGPSMKMDKIGTEEVARYGGKVDIYAFADFLGEKFNWRIHKNPSRNGGYPEFSKYVKALEFLSDKFNSGYDYPVLKVYDNEFPTDKVEKIDRYLKTYKEIIEDCRGYLLRNLGYHWWSDGNSNIFSWGARLFIMSFRQSKRIEGNDISILPIDSEGNLLIDKINRFLRIVGEDIKVLYFRIDPEEHYGKEIGLVSSDSSGCWTFRKVFDLRDGLDKSIYLIIDLVYRELFLWGGNLESDSGGIVVLEDFLVDLQPERRRNIIEAMIKVFSNIQFIIK